MMMISTIQKKEEPLKLYSPIMELMLKLLFLEILKDRHTGLMGKKINLTLEFKMKQLLKILALLWSVN